MDLVTEIAKAVSALGWRGFVFAVALLIVAVLARRGLRALPPPVSPDPPPKMPDVAGDSDVPDAGWDVNVTPGRTPEPGDGTGAGGG